MKRKSLILALIAGLSLPALAQQSYSLKEAQDYAVKHSFSAQKAELDVRTAQSKIKETTAAGLPQINAEGSYNDNIQVPSSAIDPGTFAGMPTGRLQRVQFGVRHAMTGAITASQLLFSGSYIVGLQASKAYSDLANTQKEKTEVQIRQDVASAYFLVIASKENVATLSKAYNTLEQTTKDTKALYENGLTEESSADQLTLNLNNLKNTLENATQQAEQALNLLKFQMGLPQESAISVSESMESLTEVNSSDLMDSKVDASVTLDFKLAQQNMRMQYLNLKSKRASYLPTLAMFATHQQNGFAQKFKDFDYKGGFYPATIVGFKLTVPIFSSGMKHEQVVQAKLDFDRAKIMEVQAKEGIALEQQNARINYTFQLKNFDNQKENLALAEKVKNKTAIKFKEGVASSFELSQIESQYLTAQGNYIQAVINLLNAKTQFQKAFNKLN